MIFRHDRALARPDSAHHDAKAIGRKPDLNGKPMKLDMGKG